jgi:hypothetical protein
MSGRDCAGSVVSMSSLDLLARNRGTAPSPGPSRAASTPAAGRRAPPRSWQRAPGPPDRRPGALACGRRGARFPHRRGGSATAGCCVPTVPRSRSAPRRPACPSSRRQRGAAQRLRSRGPRLYVGHVVSLPFRPSGPGHVGEDDCADPRRRRQVFLRVRVRESYGSKRRPTAGRASCAGTSASTPRRRRSASVSSTHAASA